MNVLVDTPVWSVALRRRSSDLSPDESQIRALLSELIREGRVVIIGPIRQELLSGIREHSQFKRLRDDLRSFKDLSIETLDYENAAEMSNVCRSRGVAASSVDMLICSISARSNCAIFTTDHDYSRYSKILELRLFGMES